MMRLMQRTAVVLLTCTTLVSCQIDGVDTHSLRSQAMIMNVPWETLSAAETRVSITGDDPVMERRGRADRPKKLYSEAMKTRNGSLLFEKRYNVAEGVIRTADDELLARYKDDAGLLGAGVTISKSSIKNDASLNGQMSYFVGEGKLKCFVFFMYAADSIFQKKGDILPQYQAMSGSSCVPSGTPQAAALERDMLDFTSRVKFDNGKYTRMQMFAGAFEQLRKSPADLDIEPAPDRNDHTPPIIEILSAIDTGNGLAKIEGRVTDNVLLDQIRADGRWIRVSPSGSFSSIVKVPEGSNTLKLEAADHSGNIARKNVTLLRQSGADVKRDTGKQYALIISEKNYKSPIPALDTPEQDSRDLANVLKEQYGFTVTHLMDPKMDVILAAFKDLQAKLTEEDNLLVYYAGHGVLDEKTGLGYWLPLDSSHKVPDKWISNKRISWLLRGVASRHVITIADACYSGSFTKEEALKTGKSSLGEDVADWLRGRTALSSGDLEPVADTGDGVNSLFASKLLSVLRTRRTPLSGADLAVIVRDLVHQDSPQTPQYGAVLTAGHDEGADFFLIPRTSVPDSQTKM